MYSLLDFFIDPILRAPTLGSMFMCFASSLVGTIVVIRKRSLLGEALSHAAYPGVVLSVLLFASLFKAGDDELFSFFILFGAFLSSILGLACLDILQKRFKVKNDAALCFILSAFFGVGVLVASRIQVTHALWYKQIQAFLYGQAATMTDAHVGMYAGLSGFVLLFILLFYRQIQIVNFDSHFAKTIGIRVSFIEAVLFLLLVLAVTIGIRSVGVVLMSGMLIAPAIAARQLTHKLSKMFILSSIFGAASAFFGNYLSVMIPLWMQRGHFSLPTGPMILMVGAFLCFICLFFAPERGFLIRLLRRKKFSKKCEEENLLKTLWKNGESNSFALVEVRRMGGRSFLATYLLLRRLCKQGWVSKKKQVYSLTQDGKVRASHIVRLHRLWEVYLVHLGQSREKVHASAEEMEHVITPDLEKQLSDYLNHPNMDPHCQPIPIGNKL
jgi:manganese/zinc/iron transport system permease protein